VKTPLEAFIEIDKYGEEVMRMVTYEDLFSFVIMLCAVITLVVTICFLNKKK